MSMKKFVHMNEKEFCCKSATICNCTYFFHKKLGHGVTYIKNVCASKRLVFLKLVSAVMSLLLLQLGAQHSKKACTFEKLTVSRITLERFDALTGLYAMQQSRRNSWLSVSRRPLTLLHCKLP